MGAEHGGEIPGRGLPLLLNDLGNYAGVLHADIVKRREETMPFEPDGDPFWKENPFWGDSDIQAFGALVDFLRGVHALDERMERPIDKRYQRVGQLYKLLPFTDVERGWIYDAGSHDWYKQPGDDDAMESARIWDGKALIAIDHQIITIGDRQGDDKRDFVRRWAAWRRHRDEFTDIRPFQNAMAALMDIRFAMCQDGPDLEYWNSPLRGRPDPLGTSTPTHPRHRAEPRT
jgi:hypothetical protein